VKRMQVAEVKRDFRAVLDAAERGESTVVLRYGKPVAIIKPLEDEVQRPDLPKPKEPGGLLSLLGLFDDWETMEEDMAEVVAMRQQEWGRPPPEFDG
jgi:antitoxin (DNA-binding transcriptional repressor) of toxin-antitoxin stability system